MSMAPVAQLRFAIVTGKGGVGKTTVSAAMGVRLASEGKRVLIAMCNAKERLSTMLGTPPIGPDVLEITPQLSAVNMEPEQALEEYGMMALKSRALYTLLFDNKYVRTFFRAVPGIHEWAMLGKAWWHTTELLPNGQNKYDIVILDAPATGHGLDMLRVPKVITEVVPPGLLRRDADRAWQMFQDPKLTGAVLVALPEEMPTTETLELATALRTELHIPLAKVVVNGVLPPLFTREEAALLERLPDGMAETVEADAGLAAKRRAIRERIQSECMTRLSQGLDLAPTTLPLLFEDAARPDAIRNLARRF